MKQNSERTHATTSRALQASAPSSLVRTDDDELLALRRTFYEEAEERLAEVEGLLLDLERRPDDPDLTNTIFRAVHSVKGGAAACEFSELASFAHAFESLLACLRKGQLQVTRRLLDVLLNATDVLDTLLACAKDGETQRQDAMVEHSLEAIRLELDKLPASEEPQGPVVDLSVGLVIWDDEPAAPSPPRQTPQPTPSGVFPSDRNVRPASSYVPPSAAVTEPAPQQSIRVLPVTAPALPPPKAPSAAPAQHTSPTAPTPTVPSAAPVPLRKPSTSLAPLPARVPDAQDYALDAVLVRLGAQLYGLATMHVEAFLQPSASALRDVPLHGTLLVTDERGLLPLSRLETLLGRAPSPQPASERVAVVVGVDGRRAAVLVDEVVTQGSLLVKRLEPNLQNVPSIAGAADVDGSLALVLALERLV